MKFILGQNHSCRNKFIIIIIPFRQLYYICIWISVGLHLYENMSVYQGAGIYFLSPNTILFHLYRR